MDMKAGLFQEQSLKLNMTQELKQAITLLQYSSMELASYIEDLTLENPLIDVKDKPDSGVLYHTSALKTANASKKETCLKMQRAGRRLCSSTWNLSCLA